MKIRICRYDWFKNYQDKNHKIHDKNGVTIMNDEMSKYCNSVLDVIDVFESEYYGKMYIAKDCPFYWSPKVVEEIYEYTEQKLEHPKVGENLFWELVEKYEKYGTLYIGVDFDNTLKPYGDEAYTDGHRNVLKLLRECKRLGMNLCLWSLCSDEEDLKKKIIWCKNNDISMGYVNRSPLLYEMTEKSKGHKPHFNLLLDDVAGLGEAYNVLWNVVEYIKWKKNKEEQKNDEDAD